MQRKIALRVLSQDCSSGPCERNWSTWALFHTKKRNKLTTSQLERLVYCHCNLKLIEQSGLPIEPRQVNPDKIDITKTREIPTIPQEEMDIYTLLYEEITAPAHHTRLQRGTYRRDVATISSSTNDIFDDSPLHSESETEEVDVEAIEEGEEEEEEEEEA